MSSHLDSVPFSGIIRIRDMMYGVPRSVPARSGGRQLRRAGSLKRRCTRPSTRTARHYLQTTGVPRLLELLAEKLRRENGTPIGSPDEVMVTNGGIHGLYLVFPALLEPGDEVILPDPEWPPCAGNVAAARGRAGPLSAARASRLAVRPRRARGADHATNTRDLHQLAAQPDGRGPDPSDVERIAAIVREHDLWLISDEAYEDVLFDGAEHVSPASLPGCTNARSRSTPSARPTRRPDFASAISRRDRDAPRTDEEGPLLHHQQRLVDRPVSAGSARSRDRRRASPRFGRSCRPGAISSTAAWRSAAACSRARPRKARSTPSCASTRAGRHRQAIRRRSRGRWPSTSSRAAGWLCSWGRLRLHWRGLLRFCFARDRRELSGALESMRQALAGSSQNSGAIIHNSAPLLTSAACWRRHRS